VVKQYVKAIISIGEEADNIFDHFCTLKRCYKESSLEQAVIKSRQLAEDGDIVLFTPACKSFDMFINYEHRGEVFKKAVLEL
jgi:UDP-N-acetylmuramoylalanine--D-glutamate ligase